MLPPRWKMAWRVFARGLLLAAAVTAAALTSCISPTLPIPPPATPEITAPDASGLVTLTGTAHSVQANARVLVENIDQERRCPSLTPTCDTPTVWGGDADASGAYVIVIKARHADQLRLTQIVGNEQSDGTSVVVP